MIKIDGSFCEAGGQIVRTALALSVITKKPFEVNNIRKGRPTSGLKNQHLYCIKALKELCDAEVRGDSLGSEKLIFKPGKISHKNLKIDVETAGSITLIMQSLIWPCLFSDKKISIKIIGGTDVKWSIPVDYFKYVFLPYLRKYADIEFRIERRGYYPKGQGKVVVTIKSKHDKSELKLTDKYNLIQIKGVSHACIELETPNVAERQAKAASLILNRLDCPVNIRTEYSKSESIGSGITVWAIYSKDKEDIDFLNPIIIGADALGEKGKKSEDVGREAAEKLLGEIESDAAIDKNLADNLIPLLGLFGGKIKTSEITNHTKTNIYVVEKFLNTKFKIKNNIISAELDQSQS